MRSVLILFKTAGNPSKQHLTSYLRLVLAETMIDIEDIVIADEYEISGRDEPLLTPDGEPLELG